jgi:hypothetical protein
MASAPSATLSGDASLPTLVCLACAQHFQAKIAFQRHAAPPLLVGADPVGRAFRLRSAAAIARFFAPAPTASTAAADDLIDVTLGSVLAEAAQKWRALPAAPLAGLAALESRVAAGGSGLAEAALLALLAPLVALGVNVAARQPKLGQWIAARRARLDDVLQAALDRLGLASVRGALLRSQSFTRTHSLTHADITATAATAAPASSSSLDELAARQQSVIAAAEALQERVDLLEAAQLAQRNAARLRELEQRIARLESGAAPAPVAPAAAATATTALAQPLPATRTIRVDVEKDLLGRDTPVQQRLRAEAAQRGLWRWGAPSPASGSRRGVVVAPSLSARPTPPSTTASGRWSSGASSCRPSPSTSCARPSSWCVGVCRPRRLKAAGGRAGKHALHGHRLCRPHQQPLLRRGGAVHDGHQRRKAGQARAEVRFATLLFPQRTNARAASSRRTSASAARTSTSVCVQRTCRPP